MAARASDSPRIRVAAVIPYQGRIVLVRHRFGDSVYHLLPGGGVEAGETLEDAALREVREETGLVCRLVRPLFINDTIAPDGSRHVVNVTFLAEVTGGAITEAPEDSRVEGVELAEPSRLRSLDLRPPMGDALADAAEAGFTGTAAYLGSLWVDGR